jgi:hypothetical protein
MGLGPAKLSITVSYPPQWAVPRRLPKYAGTKRHLKLETTVCLAPGPLSRCFYHMLRHICAHAWLSPDYRGNRRERMPLGIDRESQNPRPSQGDDDRYRNGGSLAPHFCAFASGPSDTRHQFPTFLCNPKSTRQVIPAAMQLVDRGISGKNARSRDSEITKPARQSDATPDA